MKHTENIFLFVLFLFTILRIWQKTELALYGTIQVRDVDNIITFFWIVFVIIAYLKGNYDGRGDSGPDR